MKKKKKNELELFCTPVWPIHHYGQNFRFPFTGHEQLVMMNPLEKQCVCVLMPVSCARYEKKGEKNAEKYSISPMGDTRYSKLEIGSKNLKVAWCVVVVVLVIHVTSFMRARSTKAKKELNYSCDIWHIGILRHNEQVDENPIFHLRKTHVGTSANSRTTAEQ